MLNIASVSYMEDFTCQTATFGPEPHLVCSSLDTLARMLMQLYPVTTGCVFQKVADIGKLPVTCVHGFRDRLWRLRRRQTASALVGGVLPDG